MKHLVLGIALATVSTLRLATAGQDICQLSRFNYKGTWETILGPGPPEVHYLESDQWPSAMGERIEAQFKAATKNSFPALPEHPGFSDSFIVEISPDQLRLVRIDYGFYTLNPSKGRMWIASLRKKVLARAGFHLRGEEVEGPSIFEISEYVSAPIPKDLGHQLETIRQSEAVVAQRKYQMAWSLKDGDDAIQRNRDTESFMREMAVSTRRNGLCCPVAAPGSPAAEARAADLEKRAEDLRSKIAVAVTEQEKRRAVILPQLRSDTLNSNGEQAAPSNGDKSSN